MRWMRGLAYAIERYEGSVEAERILLVLDAITANAHDPGAAEYLQRLYALRRITARYRYSVRFVAMRHGLIERRLPDQEALSTTHGAWEYQTVGTLMRLVPYPDTLTRIRKCIECGGWLHANKRADQVFCGRTCLQRHHQKDEGVKQRKRVTKQKASAENKKREERARIAVQQGRPQTRHTAAKARAQSVHGPTKKSTSQVRREGTL